MGVGWCRQSCSTECSNVGATPTLSLPTRWVGDFTSPDERSQIFFSPPSAHRRALPWRSPASAVLLLSWGAQPVSQATSTVAGCGRRHRRSSAGSVHRRRHQPFAHRRASGPRDCWKDPAADLMDQRHGIGIAHHGAVDVRHRQCKSRAAADRPARARRSSAPRAARHRLKRQPLPQARTGAIR